MKKIIKQLKNVNFQVTNILDIYKQSTEDEILSGKQWYKQANELSKLMSIKYKLTHIQVVGIIAALSPGTSWSQNIIDSNHLCSLLNSGKKIRFITVTTYGQNKHKAFHIYSHPELTEEEIFTVLLGSSLKVNKTSSFFSNILHPEVDDIVTIDRHSFRVNLSITEVTDIRLTEKRYKLMSTAYKLAAIELDINAIELQAVTWLTFRRLYVTIRNKEFETAPF
jgi:hypothetical protein